MSQYDIETLLILVRELLPAFVIGIAICTLVFGSVIHLIAGELEYRRWMKKRQARRRLEQDDELIDTELEQAPELARLIPTI